MTSPPTLHAPKPNQGLCRLARNPLLLASLILFYLVYVIVVHGNAEPSGADNNLSLRASSGNETPERQQETHWEPEQPKTGSHSRTSNPVKGGVEVYPLQPARRPRHAHPPAVPEVDTVEGVYTAWKFPSVYDKGGARALKGLYVLFHGCNHGPMDWFDLPEERAIVRHLLKNNYAVVAPGSWNRESGCWTVGNGKDILAVRAMLWRFYRNWSIPPETPLFLFGASSGGTMATALGREGAFQLCDKVTTLVTVSGIVSQVSWGVEPSQFKSGCPPIAFMPMPKGDGGHKDVLEDTPRVFGNTKKVPPRITAIAHNIRKSGGRPRMLLLPLGELSLYRRFFSDRVHEVSVEASQHLFKALASSNLLSCGVESDGDTKCFLTEDPRKNPLTLDTLVSAYRQSVSNGNRRLSVEDSVIGDLGTVRSLQEERGNLTSTQMTEVFRELLNVAWGAHELSADFVALWENWLWESCGDHCANWYIKRMYEGGYYSVLQAGALCEIYPFLVGCFDVDPGDFSCSGFPIKESLTFYIVHIGDFRRLIGA